MGLELIGKKTFGQQFGRAIWKHKTKFLEAGAGNNQRVKYCRYFSGKKSKEALRPEKKTL
jgi:hypothetical protein